jgi:toxin ParE1/3/4
MRVRWTTDAAEDLERICDYVARERPEAARRIALDVLRAIEGLRTFPNRGRPGRVQGTRELVLTRPFLAVYEVRDEEVQVLRILHGARQWPSS